MDICSWELILTFPAQQCNWQTTTLYYSDFLPCPLLLKGYNIFYCNVPELDHCYLNINIYLFTSSNRSTCKWPPVFVYLCKLLVVTCAVRMNINIYLFTYSNQFQQNHTQRPPLFVYLCKLLVVPCAVRMNINIYLFTYSNQCQQNHTLATTCICLFMQITCCLPVLIEWILISICLLIQNNVNKSMRSSLARSI